MKTLIPPNPAPRPGSKGRPAKWLLRCGVVAGPLFVVAFLIEGATRGHYNPLRHPVSSLALGEYGWTQTANFIVAGLLTLAFAFGVRQALKAEGGTTRGTLWGPILVGAWAVMLIGAGIFTTDPVSGYPPGTAAMRAEYTNLAAELHDLISLPGFIALFAACIVFAIRFARLRQPSWAIYSALTGAAFLTTFILATLAFSQNPSLVAYGGLFQRIAITSGWLWLTLLATRLLRQSHDTRPE
ncbi:DUF998 domain-containing protein [Nonomuraea sediminis]|uniref:DUF998 domain-containing protein n=1 Tax=Nonomuraea sediminis TaxID=2835864 RepID=UPI001BDC32CD|nr:DUF998 domain-containing protein [Nonomuraea sediminis]